LLDDYRSGATVADLVAVFEIHRTTALSHLARHGVNRRVNALKLTDEQAARAVEMYYLGQSLAKVALHFGVNAATISRELRAAPAERGLRASPPHAVRGAVARLPRPPSVRNNDRFVARKSRLAAALYAHD
jgi:transposase-like protein